MIIHSFGSVAKEDVGEFRLDATEHATQVVTSLSCLLTTVLPCGSLSSGAVQYLLSLEKQ